MAEPTTPPAASGDPAAGDSGAPGSGDSPADTFAEERQRLETQRREQQARADRAEAELAKLRAAQSDPAPPPAPPAPTSGLTLEQMRAELRRQREIDLAAGALKEQFPNATTTLANLDSFDSVEAMRFAAENEEKAFQEKVSPAVEAAVAQALKPYVEKFGSLQTPPAGAAPGAGDGLPTLTEISRMSLDELDALEKQHPGLHQRLLNESLTT